MRLGLMVVGRIRQAVIWRDDDAARGATVQIDGVPFLEILMREVASKGIERIVLIGRDKKQCFSPSKSLKELCDIRIEHIDVHGIAEACRALDGAGQLDDLFVVLRGHSWFDVPLVRLETCLAHSAEAFAVVALRETGGKSLCGGVWALRRTALAPGFLSDFPDTEPLFRRGDRNVIGQIFDAFFVDLYDPGDRVSAERRIRDYRRRPAVFLDRDGVLNIDHGYVGRPNDFEWINGAPEAIQRINRSGRRCFIVTNQAGIGQGYYSEEEYRFLRRHIRDRLAAYEAWIDDERYCPYHPDAVLPAYQKVSDWRKPAPGMILDLMANWPTDAERSFLIGDRCSDIEAASAAGIRSHLFTGGRLDALVDRVLQEDGE